MTFLPSESELRVPIHYNHIVQAAIYANLDAKIAEWLHEKGYSYGKRHYKFFTFSRLLSAARKYDLQPKP